MPTLNHLLPVGGRQVAVDLARMDHAAAMLNGQEKYFFGQDPQMLSNVFMKKSV